jgi:hypothetical protein
MYEWSFTIAAYALSWLTLLAYAFAVGARTRRARQLLRTPENAEAEP